jgi:hypothetical protein
VAAFSAAFRTIAASGVKEHSIHIFGALSRAEQQHESRTSNNHNLCAGAFICQLLRKGFESILNIGGRNGIELPFENQPIRRDAV